MKPANWIPVFLSTLAMIAAGQAVAQTDLFEPADCFNLDDNLVPEGWELEVWNNGSVANNFLDGRLWGTPMDGGIALKTSVVEINGIDRLEFGWEGSLSYSHSGMNHGIDIQTKDGKQFRFLHQTASYNFQLGSALIFYTPLRYLGPPYAQPGDPTYGYITPYSSEYGGFRHELILQDEHAVLTVTRLSEGSLVCEMTREIPELHLADVATVKFGVYATVGNSCWMDNLCFAYTALDLEPPAINCPGDFVSDANADCGGAIPDVLSWVTATDNYDADVALTQTPEIGTPVGLGEHLITVTAMDDAGNTATCTTTFTVRDVTAPVITGCAPSQVADADANCQALVPDFVGGVVASDCSGPVAVSQNPAAGTAAGLGETLVTLTVTDKAGNSATCTTTFTVRDVTAPVITGCAPSQVADADANCQALVPDFVGGVVASDCSGPVGVSQNPAAGTPVGLGETLVTLTVTDAAGNSATCNTSFTVRDVTAPVITSCAPSQVADADANCQALVPDFVGGVVASDCSGPVEYSQNPAAGTAAGLGETLVTLTVTDKAGNSATCTTTFTVRDVTAPVAGEISGPQDPQMLGSVVSMSAGFADNCGAHTALWIWGDGTSSGGLIEQLGRSGSVTGSHVYASVGVYRITLVIADSSANASQVSFEYVVVYDPAAGFVTGGGWITSPQGAYAIDPSLTGKAHFGFVSRYKKGASIPTGQTEFTFSVANLNFHSESYEWLVIAGRKAQYKGIGTINGSGNYGFMLTAIDGDLQGGGRVDRFRIKIWNKDQGNGVVYDNQLGAADDGDPTTALGGGSIVIHQL